MNDGYIFKGKYKKGKKIGHGIFIFINGDIFEGFYKDGKKFDIIFLDPPYKLNLINNCLSLIKKLDLLNNNGIIICEYETEVIDYLDFELIKDKKYGSKKIKIFKNIK